MVGLNWTMDSTMEGLAERLDAGVARAVCRFRQQRFRHQHGYVLENYLVAYVFRSPFTFGSQAVNRQLAEYNFHNSITRQYQLTVAEFAVIETLLAGLADFYGKWFGMPAMLKLIQ